MDNDSYIVPRKNKAPIWVWTVILPISLIFCGLVGLGTMTMIGLLPSTEVQAGSNVPKKQLEKLFEAEILLKGEVVEYFYSEGIYSILEGGNILTKDTVISYTQDEDGELLIYDIDVDEIIKIEEIEKGNFFTDAIYRISEAGTDEDWLEIWLSVENDGHLKFMDTLAEKISPKVK